LSHVAISIAVSDLYTLGEIGMISALCQEDGMVNVIVQKMIADAKEEK
jgi:hypothetical protein